MLHKKINTHNILQLAVVVAILFGSLLAAQITAIGTASAAPARFYNQPSDSIADATCNPGDHRLNPAIQFNNPEVGRGIVYYCMSMPEGSVVTGPGSLRQGSSCPANYGGLDAGGFGFHCIPNNQNDPFYTPGGTPVLDSSGGGTYTGNVSQPKYVKSDCNDTDINEDNCGIIRYLVIAINILSGLVGVVVAGSIIFAGIQYATAGSDPQKVSAAKARIRNSIFALVFFIFTYSLLNYLVPGGVL